MIVYPLPVKLRFYWPMSSNSGISAILRIYLRFGVISVLRISFHFSGISAVLRVQIHLDEFSTFMYFYHISLKSPNPGLKYGACTPVFASSLPSSLLHISHSSRVHRYAMRDTSEPLPHKISPEQVANLFRRHLKPQISPA